MLESYFPKHMLDKIRSNEKDTDWAEHDKIVSFDTKVECISEFFKVEGDRIEKQIRLKQGKE
jgi:hypothetical protein